MTTSWFQVTNYRIARKLSISRTRSTIKSKQNLAVLWIVDIFYRWCQGDNSIFLQTSLLHYKSLALYIVSGKINHKNNFSYLKLHGYFRKEILSFVTINLNRFPEQSTYWVTWINNYKEFLPAYIQPLSLPLLMFILAKSTDLEQLSLLCQTTWLIFRRPQFSFDPFSLEFNGNQDFTRPYTVYHCLQSWTSVL